MQCRQMNCTNRYGGVKISNTYKGQFLGDNTGNNISDKNLCFNELTVLYWAWKNSKADIKGLVHYRRFLGSKSKSSPQFYDNILKENECISLLGKYDIIVPKAKRYYVVNIYKHYTASRASLSKDLIGDLHLLKEAITKQCPSYLDAYDKVMSRTWAHMLNIFVAKREIFDDYCKWMFSLLFYVEQHLGKRKSRVCGAIGEMMLDIYITKNKLNYVELPLAETEKKPFVKKLINKIKCMRK